MGEWITTTEPTQRRRVLLHWSPGLGHGGLERLYEKQGQSNRVFVRLRSLLMPTLTPISVSSERYKHIFYSAAD